MHQEGEDQCKPAALAFDAFYFNASVVCLHDLLHIGQSQPEAGRPRSERLLAAEARSNFSKIRAWSFNGMPNPLSETLILFRSEWYGTKFGYVPRCRNI